MTLVKCQPTEPIVPVIPDDVRSAVLAANTGDSAALPALKRALADHPELIDLLGDLAAFAERTLIAHVAAPSLAAAEAATLHLAKMRKELGMDSAPPLERLLITRVVLCWLACHAAEIDRGDLLKNGASELLKAADKRVDRAHARLLSATKTLAIVRKLSGPALPRLALLGAPVNHETPVGVYRLPVAAG